MSSVIPRWQSHVHTVIARQTLGLRLLGLISTEKTHHLSTNEEKALFLWYQCVTPGRRPLAPFQRRCHGNTASSATELQPAGKGLGLEPG